ncbi:hypothetical protein JG688_00002409 [Phytophthora aleatoria]|uniref:Uncharacterized protein n=1 Tax=Phytophthora aleatoria TaxID=2496075 RepID=A0A8J5MAS0_9STRA|nr:hypothetical protein JG688_00002409 [Phytophthora aleatoria]
MWKKGNGKYAKENAKFFVSGQNSDEFYDCCDGNLDAVYLKICTRVKPELAGFINGVMHPEDEMDSMNLAAILRTVSANKLSKWQGQVIQTINRLGNFIVGAPTTAAASATGTQNRGSNDEDLLIDRIGKLYQLIAQVQERQHKVELTGVSDPALAASLCKYQQRLQRYEDQLKAFEQRLLLNHQQSNGVSPKLLRQG